MTKLIFSIVAVLFVLLGIYYFITPADALLHFVPGYEVGVRDVHVKHGIACLVLALGSGLLVWFASGPKVASEATESTKQ